MERRVYIERITQELSQVASGGTAPRDFYLEEILRRAHELPSPKREDTFVELVLARKPVGNPTPYSAANQRGYQD